MPRYRRSLALDHWDRVLTDSVKNNTQVLINCRNNKKLLGRVKAFEGTAIWFLSRSKRFGLKSLRLAKAPKEGKASKQGCWASNIMIPPNSNFQASYYLISTAYLRSKECHGTCRIMMFYFFLIFVCRWVDFYKEPFNIDLCIF